MPFEELSLLANGLQFHAIAEGPKEGPLVILLHGFPELSLSWRAQLPALAAAGFRAVAPDLRGFGKSELTGPFDMRTLSADVAALIAALGKTKATVVGHDWGGAVAWATAALQPACVERLCILNCPHPSTLARAFISNPRQLLRSWYMLFFLVPWLPERALAAGHAALIGRGLRQGTVRKDVWTQERLAPYLDSFSRPAAARAAVDYYRTAMRDPLLLDPGRVPPISAPVKIIWGSEDRFLGRELIETEKLRPYFAAGNLPSIEILEGAGHFVQAEAPDEVNRALLKFLTTNSIVIDS